MEQGSSVITAPNTPPGTAACTKRPTSDKKSQIPLEVRGLGKVHDRVDAAAVRYGRDHLGKILNLACVIDIVFAPPPPVTRPSAPRRQNNPNRDRTHAAAPAP